jgi:CHASE2 domain-containing sensor protein
VLNKTRQNIKTAHDTVSSKLNKARTKKVLKIGGAFLATTAAVATGVVTFGAGTVAVIPVITTLLGLLGTIINDVKVAREILK